MTLIESKFGPWGPDPTPKVVSTWGYFLDFNLNPKFTYLLAIELKRKSGRVQITLFQPGARLGPPHYCLLPHPCIENIFKPLTKKCFYYSWPIKIVSSKAVNRILFLLSHQGRQVMSPTPPTSTNSPPWIFRPSNGPVCST